MSPSLSLQLSLPSSFSVRSDLIEVFKMVNQMDKVNAGSMLLLALK